MWLRWMMGEVSQVPHLHVCLDHGTPVCVQHGDHGGKPTVCGSAEPSYALCSGAQSLLHVLHWHRFICNMCLNSAFAECCLKAGLVP